MLNSNIKIDLHIHSAESKYKDGSIVEDSKIENLDSLLSKLNDNEISMFSITDHNRFDYKIYEKAVEKVNSNVYPKIKKCLPAIEFDVSFLGDDRCHIIAVFDDKDISKIKNISNAINETRKLESKDDFYSIKEFSEILHKISTSTILIAHQKNSILTSHNNGQTNLSDAVNNMEEFYRIIKFGYIDALEFGNNKSEAIVKDSLKEIGLENIPLISGSDCHTWSVYPARSKGSSAINRFTEIKALPTFKGLLLSITSPQTRFNRNLSSHKSIDSIGLNGETIRLSGGINAIIGDNGSGKSFLWSKLTNSDIKKYKELKKSNDVIIHFDTVIPTDIFSVRQGEVQEAIQDGKLIPDGHSFVDINHDLFDGSVNDWKNKYKEYVATKFELFNISSFLSSKSIVIEVTDELYFLQISCDIKESHNPHKQRTDNIKKILVSLKKELDDNKTYYDNNAISIDDVIRKIEAINEVIDVKNESVVRKNKVCSLIIKEIIDFNAECTSKSNTAEAKIRAQNKLTDEIIEKIADEIKLRRSVTDFPLMPNKVTSGESHNTEKGYVFQKIAKYYNADIKNELLSSLFNKGTSDLQIFEFNSTTDFLMLCNGFGQSRSKSITSFNDWIDQKISVFLNDFKKEETIIKSVESQDTIGATPGEISLMYYKYRLNDLPNEVIIIDQPEDDINPLKLSKMLVKYFDQQRENKQIIFITHNPILVVNLDVDNVIFLCKNSTKLHINSGCLEYEWNDHGESNSILSIIENNLDGGLELIQKRMKIYGQKN